MTSSLNLDLLTDHQDRRTSLPGPRRPPAAEYDRPVSSRRLLSVVVPVYNEAEGIGWFHQALVAILHGLAYEVEVIYVDDGSSDHTQARLQDLAADDTVAVRIVELSRNFGKEAALSAGVTAARGDAVLMLDADGQHPLELLPEFVAEWERGSEVVIGIRSSDDTERWGKRLCSRAFYATFNRVTGAQLVPRSTDFRLIDRLVADQLVELKESNRITRGLIDWLGFRRAYIGFQPQARRFGTAGYTFRKLCGLAVNCFVSLSCVPLFLAGYLGLVFMGTGFLGGAFVLVEQVLLDDPLGLRITGTAMLGILTVFLVGAILSAQGLTGVYLGRVLRESQGRPLYVVRRVSCSGAGNPAPGGIPADDSRACPVSDRHNPEVR
jgi:dolichol-phosphate mannosyltransferase